jgi:hypothetical protein
MGFYRSWIGGGGELVRRYTSSLQDDVEIAEEVVKVMEAHVKHLAEVGAVPREAAEAILKALKEVDPAELVKSGFEDVHEALEKWLIDRLGEEVGGWGGRVTTTSPPRLGWRLSGVLGNCGGPRRGLDASWRRGLWSTRTVSCPASHISRPRKS